MTRQQTLRMFEGSQVSVSLRDGSRLDDCQLVSAGRTGTRTMWLFSNGDDVFVAQDDVIDVWESAA
jgi:hypothetical protein